MHTSHYQKSIAIDGPEQISASNTYVSFTVDKERPWKIERHQAQKSRKYSAMLKHRIAFSYLLQPASQEIAANIKTSTNLTLEPFWACMGDQDIEQGSNHWAIRLHLLAV